MSALPNATYHFLAWARRGVGASVNNPDGGSLPSRASLGVQLALGVQGGPAPQPSAMTVQMFGPGDVIGIDPRHVIRTEPRDSTTNYEPNYLCGIEFDTPDFPWLFTPAAPNKDRLRPWIALIAIKPGEFKLSPLAPNPLPVIEVQTVAALHDLSESWNWAHAQVSGDMSLADALAGFPGHVLSRLLCPRRLDPETHYTAFLVPAFEIGRQAGLGQDVSGLTKADPAWTKQTAVPLRLPFYYQFQFHTSDAGDFESLVRRLTPRVLPAGVGQRLMDVTRPAPGVPSAGGPLGLAGALHSVSTQPTAWKDPDKTAFQSAVQAWINQPAAATFDPANPGADPVVTPPIYGRWHAAVQAVDRTAAGWVNDLNLDPRNRAVAGMGTQVVQGERAQLMASAWQQVDGVLKANQLLRQAQLARAVMQQLYRQHFQRALPDTTLHLTAPVHARLLVGPTTIRAAVRASRVPERMLSATFRRVTRLRRRFGAAPASRPTLLSRVNTGELTFAPTPKAPDGMVSLAQVSQRVVSLAPVALPKAAAIDAPVSVSPPISVSPPTLPVLDLRLTTVTTIAIAQVPPRPTFTLTLAGTALGAGTPAIGPDSAPAIAFRVASQDFAAVATSLPVDPPQAPSLDVTALKTTVLTRLDPAVTVPKRTRALIALPAQLNWHLIDPIAPIMAAPEFPQPMYAPLRDLSPQYILPGVELIPPDTLGLLVANHAFIEGYMVGLNHEMARQLLWNNYPTDQRGSYFRQFWDVSAYVPRAGDPSDPAQLNELLKDIPAVHTWPLALPLGQHPNRGDVVANNVVLLVRGELFKRYPNAIVYAGKAKLDAPNSARRVLDETDERYPIFRGTLAPDMTFLGFNLSLADARGGTPASPQGFFFVFQEQPSEPRFGLEPTESTNPITDWANLAWTNFGAATAGGAGTVFKLPNLGNTTRGKMIANSPWRLASQVFSLALGGAALPGFLSPAAQAARVALAAKDDPNGPNNQWGVNSAQTAYILLRLPFRILIHADMMLPQS